MSRQRYTVDQTTKAMHRKHEQQYLLTTKKLNEGREQSNLSKLRNSDTHSIKSSSTMRSSLKKNVSSKSLCSTASTSTDSQQSISATKRFMPHPFFNVYNGMSYEEWAKTRDAFVAAYFKE